MDRNPYNADFLLKRLMEKTTDSIYFKDAESRFVMVNKTLAESWGYDAPEELVGRGDFDSFCEEDARLMLNHEQEIMQTGEAIEGLEEETTWKDGHTAWSSTSKMPLIDDDGKTVGTFGISRNITEHKQAELKIEQYAKKLRRINEEMKEELRMAAELQRSFFPHRYPVFPPHSTGTKSAAEFLHFFQPGGLVSGDLCVMRQLSDSECGILLCDVMGHGVRAALGTALIYASIDELALQEHDPAAFLGLLNKRLFPALRTENLFLYVTACYAVFDASSGRLRIANAGHPAPLLMTAAGQEAEWAIDPDQRGPALAISETAEYASTELQLSPGDSIIMYTDGLYEVENAAGEEFGEDGVLQVASAMPGGSLSQIFQGLVENVSNHADGRGFEDDLCMAGLTCRYHC